RGDLARQRAEAAESLWAAGHPAEALRLMLDGLERMGEAVRAWFEGTGEQLDGADRKGQEQSEGQGGENSAEAMEVPSAHKVPFAVFERFIQVRNKGEGALRRIQEAKSKIEAMKLPLLDSEVSPAHGELFEALVDVRLIVARSLGEVSILPREIFVKRIVRSGIAGFAFFAGVVGLYLAFHVPEGIHARASSYFNNHPDYEPSKALDGNPDTSWLLPDHTRGWFEITINPPRTISKVKILNTHNPPYNDRATIDYTLKVFAKGKEVKSFNCLLYTS
ncbi:MAG: discoidin domain-containing protein, partial [Deltaproteobacteria bacterium]|nr:discoidin domain-containing protein [Deltaproteobacteria bacterium]